MSPHYGFSILKIAASANIFHAIRQFLLIRIMTHIDFNWHGTAFKQIQIIIFLETVFFFFFSKLLNYFTFTLIVNL